MSKYTGSGQAGNKPHHLIQEEMDRDLRNAKMFGDSMDAVFKAMFNKPAETTNQQSTDPPEEEDDS